jgi:hypothetical protein
MLAKPAAEAGLGLGWPDLATPGVHLVELSLEPSRCWRSWSHSGEPGPTPTSIGTAGVNAPNQRTPSLTIRQQNG